MDILLKLANTDSELAIIASILVDETNVVTCLNSRLKVNDFSHKTYQLIYKTILDLYKSNINIDLTTVVSELKKNDIDVSMSILATYIQHAVPTNIESYVMIVKEMAYKRHIAEKLMNIIKYQRYRFNPYKGAN